MPNITVELYTFHSFYDDIQRKMIHKKYHYMNVLSHLNLIFEGGEVKKYNQIYWEEILMRTHYASTISLLRHKKWLEGITLSIEENNYILFSSSLRGFLESVTDSYYSLFNVPFDLSNNFNNINLAIKGELGELFLSSKMEENLIHFQFAKKVRKTDKSPDYLKALNTAKYIDIFSVEENNEIKNLYKLLCEVVHPASDSVNSFTKTMKMDDQSEYTTTDTKLDDIKIAEILNTYGKEIGELLKLSINIPFICLKLLGLFDCESVNSTYIDTCIFNTQIDNKIWIMFLRNIDYS